MAQDQNDKLWDTDMPAWRKRFHHSRWAGDACEYTCNHYDFAARMRMTMDGTNDNLIKIDGMDNYSFTAADAGDVPAKSDDEEEEKEEEEEEDLYLVSVDAGEVVDDW